MAECSYKALLQNPSFIQRLRRAWSALPKKVRSQHRHIRAFLGGDGRTSYVDTSLVEADLKLLLKNSTQMGALVRRAMNVTSNMEDKKSTIAVMSEDVLGNAIEVDLDGGIESLPALVHGSELISSSPDGLFKFKRSTDGREIVVYNPAADNTLSYLDEMGRGEMASDSLFTGRLPARVAFSALFHQNLALSDSSPKATLLKRIKVKGAEGFDPEKVYSGYQFKSVSGGSWMPLSQFMAYKGTGLKDRSSAVVRIHDPEGPMQVFMVSGMAIVLENMRNLFYAMRQIGAVMNPFFNFKLNMQKGEVVLEPGADVAVMDIDKFASDESGLVNQPDFDTSVTDFRAQFVPNVAARAMGEDSLSISAERLLLKHGDRRYVTDYWTPETVIHTFLRDQGVEKALRRVKEDGRVSPVELAALYDYVYEVVDRRLHGLVHADKHTNNVKELSRRSQQAVKREVTEEEYRAFMDSFDYYLGMSVMRAEVESDLLSRRVFEKGRDILIDNLSDESLGDDWKELFERYVRTNGNRQISMFYAKDLPLLAYASHVDASQPFFERAYERIDLFDARKEILSWETFGEDARRASTPPDRGPGGGGGVPRGSRFEHSASPESGMAQVIQFPMGGREGYTGMHSAGLLPLRSALRLNS